MYFPVFVAPARRLRRVGACAIGVLQSARCHRQRGRGDLKKATGLAAAGWILAVAVVLGLTGAARGAAATLTDIGAASPAPGAYDIYQLNGAGSNDPAGLNYFDNNGSPPGQTFTTGSSASSSHGNPTSQPKRRIRSRDHPPLQVCQQQSQVFDQMEGLPTK